MSKNYKMGEPITTLDGLMKEKVAFFNGRLINREFFQNFQFRFLLNQVEYGRVHKAVPINPPDVSGTSIVGYYYTVDKDSLLLYIYEEELDGLCVKFPCIPSDGVYLQDDYAFSAQFMEEVFAMLGVEKLDKLPEIEYN